MDRKEFYELEKRVLGIFSDEGMKKKMSESLIKEIYGDTHEVTIGRGYTTGPYNAYAMKDEYSVASNDVVKKLYEMLRVDEVEAINGGCATDADNIYSHGACYKKYVTPLFPGIEIVIEQFHKDEDSSYDERGWHVDEDKLHWLFAVSDKSIEKQAYGTPFGCCHAYVLNKAPIFFDDKSILHIAPSSILTSSKPLLDFYTFLTKEVLKGIKIDSEDDGINMDEEDAELMTIAEEFYKLGKQEKVND